MKLAAVNTLFFFHFSVNLGAAPPKETPAATAAVSEPKPPAKETPTEETPAPSEIPTTPPPGTVTCRVIAWDQSPWWGRGEREMGKVGRGIGRGEIPLCLPQV